MRKARAGTVPGTKVGRRWVFIEADLLAFIREKIKERACRSIANLRAPTGGSDSQSAASKLDARLRQLTGKPQDRKSTRLNSSNPSTSYAVFCLKKKIKQRRQTHTMPE